MKQLKKLEPARRGYPWKRWANGKPWRAEQGKDFHCKVETFRTSVYDWALRHGYKAQATVKGTAVEFRFKRQKAAAK